MRQLTTAEMKVGDGLSLRKELSKAGITNTKVTILPPGVCDCRHKLTVLLGTIKILWMRELNFQ